MIIANPRMGRRLRWCFQTSVMRMGGLVRVVRLKKKKEGV